MAPISNDLMLAAALTSAVPAALAQTTVASNTPRTGVATTVTSNSARGATSSIMYIDGTTNQRLTTNANSTLHVLFSDQSAITMGPNSEVVIAKYEFDSKAKNGQILIDMTKGFLRVVGGLISKKSEALVRTSTATIGIRGGIADFEVVSENVAVEITEAVDSRSRAASPLTDETPAAAPARTTATLLFGDEMRVSDPNGNNTQTVNRPGFTVTSGADGSITSPTRAPGSNTQAPAPDTQSTNTQVNGQLGSLSSTRLSDTSGTSLVTNPGGGGGGGGAPNLATLLGSSNIGSQS